MVSRTSMPAIALVGVFVLAVLAFMGACEGKTGHQVPKPEASGDAGRNGPVRPADYSVWCELLKSALQTSVQARAFVGGVASNPPSVATGRLATLILSEWKLDPSSEEFSQPRQVYMPEVDLAAFDRNTQLKMKPWAFVEGIVNENGLVLEPHIRLSSDNAQWDKMCLQAFAQAQYRPARENDHYVRKKSIVGCEMHFK